MERLLVGRLVVVAAVVFGAAVASTLVDRRLAVAQVNEVVYFNNFEDPLDPLGIASK